MGMVKGNGKPAPRKAGGNRPALRLVAKDKETGSRADVFAAWPNERIDGNFNVKLGEGVRIRAKDRDGNDVTISNDSHYLDLEPPFAARQAAAESHEADA